MINPLRPGAIAAIAAIVVLAQPMSGFAQNRTNERAAEHAIVPPLPPMRTKPGVIVPPMASPIVGPIGSPHRQAMPLPPPVPNHPFEHERDRNHGGDRGAFAAGVAAGVVLGGAIATPPPGVYYVPTPSPIYDPVGYCTWMYSSYDPQSGTYIGDDGNPHPCP